MTSVEVNKERGCWELRDFPTPNDLHSHGLWDKRKNLYLLRNYIIPNEATAMDQERHGHRPCFLVHQELQVGHHVISQWVWVLATFQVYDQHDMRASSIDYGQLGQLNFPDIGIFHELHSERTVLC